MLNDATVEQLPAGSAPLGLLSANEFLPGAQGFDEALLEASAGAHVGVILCADHRAARNSLGFAERHFASMGAQVTMLPHGEGFDEVDIAYLAGGSPADLTSCTMLRTRWPAIEARWRAGELTLAGSSAGAMSLCTYCLVPTPGAKMPTRWTAEGFGPLRETALAVHASSRSDEWLELIAASKPSGVALVALDDDAGILLRPEVEARTIGGRVRILP